MIEDLLLIGLFTSGEDAIPILQEDPFCFKGFTTVLEFFAVGMIILSIA